MVKIQIEGGLKSTPLVSYLKEVNNMITGTHFMDNTKFDEKIVM